jgi:SRSO17 transposase
MKPSELRALDQQLSRFSEKMFAGMGRQERREAMASYVTGLLLDGERKSIEPMAARLVGDATKTEAMRQRLQQCVSVSTWADDEVRRRLALEIERHLPGVEALVLDDTGFPKKGRHSVGVARQYSGTLGRTDNCQVAVSLHLAGEKGSACIGMRLYLPKVWAEDQERRASVGVPQEVEFQTKWQIALDQLDAALRWGVRQMPVLADAGYGDVTEFREALTRRGLPYLAQVAGSLKFWLPGGAPGEEHHRPGDEPLSLEDIASLLGRDLYRPVGWREGSRGKQRSNFATLRVRRAHGYRHGRAPGMEEWLLCEWPDGAEAPTKFWLSTLPAATPRKELVRLAKLRWRVERDYQELKGEVGLDHFEGRTWRGFHHHATLCAVAHGFLALHRALSPPIHPSMDLVHGPASLAAGAHPPTRFVPAVPPPGSHACPTARPLSHLIT